MPIELRTYDLRPGAAGRFLAGFDSQALSHGGGLIASWHTEVGQLNQVIQAYEHNSRRDAEASIAALKAPDHLPEDLAKLTLAASADIMTPAPFSPNLPAGTYGPIHEIRDYQLAPGSLPAVIDMWTAMVPERLKMSPMLATWYSDEKTPNRWVHVWAYATYEDRVRTRTTAIEQGLWPPKSPPGALLNMRNSLCVPSAFSPWK